MASTASIPVLCQYMVDKFNTNKIALAGTLSIPVEGLGVFYGDQDLIPSGYAICVEPETKRRQLNGVRRRTANEIRIGVLAYAGIIADPQGNRKKADELAEALETLVHADATFGADPNQLLHGSLVETIESGYQKKGSTTLRTSRLIVLCESQTFLPPNP